MSIKLTYWTGVDYKTRYFDIYNLYQSTNNLIHGTNYIGFDFDIRINHKDTFDQQFLLKIIEDDLRDNLNLIPIRSYYGFFYERYFEVWVNDEYVLTIEDEKDSLKNWLSIVVDYPRYLKKITIKVRSYHDRLKFKNNKERIKGLGRSSNKINHLSKILKRYRSIFYRDQLEHSIFMQRKIGKELDKDAKDQLLDYYENVNSDGDEL